MRMTSSPTVPNSNFVSARMSPRRAAPAGGRRTRHTRSSFWPWPRSRRRGGAFPGVSGGGAGGWEPPREKKLWGGRVFGGEQKRRGGGGAPPPGGGGGGGGGGK